MVNYEEEIRQLQEEISKTQYNKATQHHIGLVKAKIARLKERAVARSKGGKKGEGYAVRKSGDATVILIGFPSVGKSTLLNKITNAESKTAAYDFTTLTCIPGIMEYNGAKIQVLDVPGILKGAASGLGKGKEVIAVARNADLAILMVDVFTVNQIDILRKELEEADIRANQQPPHVTITRKERGGLSIATTVNLTKIDEKTIEAIFNEFRIVSADVVIREDINADQLIDAIEGNRKYVPAIAVVNKIDSLNNEGMKQLQQQLHNPNLAKQDWAQSRQGASRQQPTAQSCQSRTCDLGSQVTDKSEEVILISAEKNINIDKLKEKIYNKLSLIRVYLKEVGKKPDLQTPLIMRQGITVREVCEKLHRDFVAKFKFSRVWGRSAKFPGQKFKIDHKLADKDVVEIHLR